MGALTCALCAPTGLAAYNIIHRLFQLPVEHEGKTSTYWPLPKESVKVMRNGFRHLKLIIIDEVSMLSSLNLAYIHLRLEELFGGDQWFGGINILFVGDILQLPPVHGSPVFQSISNKLIATRLGCLTSVNIWHLCVEYDELIINQRQKEDVEFGLLLNDVRTECMVYVCVFVVCGVCGVWYVCAWCVWGVVCVCMVCVVCVCGVCLCVECVQGNSCAIACHSLCLQSCTTISQRRV